MLYLLSSPPSMHVWITIILWVLFVNNFSALYMYMQYIYCNFQLSLDNILLQSLTDWNSFWKWFILVGLQQCLRIFLESSLYVQTRQCATFKAVWHKMDYSKSMDNGFDSSFWFHLPAEKFSDICNQRKLHNRGFLIWAFLNICGGRGIRNRRL